MFGCLALATLPGARRGRIEVEDRPRVALVGLLWMALPMTIFPIAEQWIPSSVTGMLNGSMPLFAAAVAAIMLRRPPGRRQQAGILVGFLGVVAISLPSMQGGSRTALGAPLVVVAMISYGVATNVVVPLQQRYGALPVIWRAQMVAIVLTAPYGLVGLASSSFAWGPVGAVVLLGAFGTGLAFVAAGTLIGRVGRDPGVGARVHHPGGGARARRRATQRARRGPGDRRARPRAGRRLVDEPRRRSLNQPQPAKAAITGANASTWSGVPSTCRATTASCTPASAYAR